ncbi:hypothetical protein PV11_07201 [Exophiala sideris]|uniref:Fe2OG dioxygenase domain-containing protein n=1 Tax=Exophiala sideris TaxID=1016849 RepID=A0A0D1YXW7_9EURO|nr:hypothetical protein PV11_07201 [Exophiala sideris]
MQQYYVDFGPFGEPAALPLVTEALRKETFTSVPVIDLSALRSSDERARAALTEELRVACRDVGFFYASGHVIPNCIMEGAMQATKEFFDLPDERKQAVNFHRSAFFRGYEDLYATRHQHRGRGDNKEAFSFTYDDKNPGHNQWPDNYPDFRTIMVKYHTALCHLAQQIHATFAEALSLPPNHFAQVYKKCGASVRALHYPPQKPQEVDDEVGFGAHTDSSWFTLVNQDNVGALEVQNENGVWIPVEPKEGTFVVNIGDLMQFVSGGKLKSTRHRVVNRKGMERYSIAFFWSPNESDVLEVAQTCRVSGQAYSDLVVKDYLQMRFRGSRLSHPLLKDETSMRAPSGAVPAKTAVLLGRS